MKKNHSGFSHGPHDLQDDDNTINIGATVAGSGVTFNADPSASLSQSEAGAAAHAAETLETAAPQALPTDPLLGSQWYLNGTWGIHANLVWPDYTGVGIKLADFDDGFQYTHPDLVQNYNTSLDVDYADNDSDAAAVLVDDNHGTAVMGIMIADNNGQGIVGVAYDGIGVGIRQSFGNDATIHETLEGFQYVLTKNIDVMNNSWAYTIPFSDDFTDNSTSGGSSLVDVANEIRTLAANGRSGLGANIVFAGGNSGDVGDNVNYHNFQNSPYVITVAAIDSSGKQASFSNPGTALLVSAGGVGDETTDRTGTAGYVNGDYSSENGTSFAAPIVSGTIALMLQANPNLGWRDVQEILAYSAQHNDPGNSTWEYNGAANWNGGGLHYSMDYGFGAVNAYAAVRLAETWTLQQTSSNMTSFTTATASPHASIPDSNVSGVTSSITVSQDIQIEHVQVHVNLAHNYIGDLVVTLIAPDGTESILVNRPGIDAIGDMNRVQDGITGIDFTLETNADWGESSAGTWTLKVADVSAFTTGTFNSWNLTFLGADASADNLYVFNDEFGSFTGAALAARSQINDTNGGNDTLNLSMVTTGSTIDLNAGTGTIAGKAVTISGIENVYGGDGSDHFTGTSGDNLLYGGRGNDILDGGAGTDTLIGGAGNDTYYVDSVSDVVTENAGEGIDTIIANFSVNLASFANFENAGLSGTGNFNLTGTSDANSLTGNSGVNTISGGDGADVLDGGAGNDTLIGGLGNDTYYVDSSGDVITENAGEGTDVVYASASYVLSANIETITLTGTGNIDATGNAILNTLIGNSGNNVLDGAAGADTMIGGLGNDSYYIDNAGDVVTENANAGTDSVFSSISYTLLANFENLTLTGSTNINATGNSVVNTLTGNAGDNTLDGGAGADTMIGGAGNDVYIVDTSGDKIIENPGEGTDTVVSSFAINLASFANVENATLSGAASVALTGNAGINILTGNSGNNTLDGGAGADTMIGGDGNDTYIVDDSADLIQDTTGLDTVMATVSYALSSNLEKLIINSATGVTATGNAIANTLTVNDRGGDSTLDGGGGADIMSAGAGNDVYIVDNIGDVVTEAANAGTDTVRSSVTYTLGANLENLVLTGTDNINGKGNTTVNILTGNADDNTLDGSAGADTMIGGDGNDTYVVDNAGDVITELADGGIDTVMSSLSVNLTAAGFANIENATLTGTAALNVTGNAEVNTLIGNAGNNTLDGGAGADTMIGGAGNDTYIVDDAGDVIIDTAGTDIVKATGSYTLGDGIEQLLISSTGGVTAGGNSLNNVITVNDNGGNSTLDGGAGADTLSGGLGDDTYIVDNIGDKLTEGVNGGTDTVLSSISYTLLANFENLTLTGGGNINAKGNTVGNILTGNSGNNTLDGGAGADTMSGGDGNDTYYIDNAGDVVIEGANGGNDTIISAFAMNLGTDAPNIENFTLTGTSNGNITGSAAINILTGNSGANTIDGGAGADTMIGGAGNDTYIVDDSGDVITDTAGLDIVKASVSYTLSANLEQLIITSATGVTAIGNAGVNIITVTGNADVNTLDGGAGADTMTGTAGNDTYFVDNAGDKIIDAGGIDTIDAAITYTLAAGFEHLTLTGTANINAKGNELDNIIFGNSGNNTLDGGLGADEMHGGAGNDIYYIDNPGDTVVENPNEGTDTVISGLAIDLSVFANVENATLTGTGNFNLTGNTANNLLSGNSGNNTLDGGTGADTMIGGAGNDTYIVDSSADVITDTAGIDAVQASASYVLATGLETLSLTGSGNINGTGNAAANMLFGNSGDNTLNGMAGADTMAGGLGNDTYVVDSAGDIVTEASNAGTDTVISSISFDLSLHGANVENLTLSGTAAINGIGNDFDNTLMGNNGANTLDGGQGADTMIGGLGNDTYIVDNIGDVVIETSTLAAEHDTVRSSISYTLGANLENLTLTGPTGLVGTGNELVNTLIGTSGDDTLDGKAGADYMTGGLGNDTYYVDNVKDVLTEAAGTNSGTDTVHSSVDWTLGANFENLMLDAGVAVKGTGNTVNNVITGNDNANTLNGMAGDDMLDGGHGHDILTGGTGADHFVFSAAGYAGASDSDIVTDFSAAQGDVIDIHDVLIGYDGNASEFVQLTSDNAGNTNLLVDRDGAGTTYSFTQVAQFTHVVLTDEDSLVQHGTLIVA